jgi:cytochrome b
LVKSAGELVEEPVWDVTTRVWHWLLATSVITGWLLGEFRSFSIMQWHFYAGYCTATLLLFRIYWGLKGPELARFSSLVFRPAEVIAYLKTLGSHDPSGARGHSPIGAMAVMVFLALLVTQVSTGLFSEDDGLFYEGPLASLVSSDTTKNFTSIHNKNAKLILVMFVLHIGAVIFYHVWKKENLVKAMFTGRKLVRKTRTGTSSS